MDAQVGRLVSGFEAAVRARRRHERDRDYGRPR